MSRRRFPRLKKDVDAKKFDKDMRYLRELKNEHPLPHYDQWRDGGYNPGEWIITFNYYRTKKQLRKLCKKHALEYRGRKLELVKRLYLHWRSAKLELGEIYYGYGPGHEYVRQPDCVCGTKLRADRIKFEERREELKEIAKRQYIKFMTPTIHRFPRYKKGRIHFPRLAEK